MQNSLSYTNINKICEKVSAFTLQTFVNGEVIPLYQTVVQVSYTKCSAFFKNFFSEWLREKLLPPNQLILFPNLNAIEAATSVFNHDTLSKYLEKCLKAIDCKNFSVVRTLCIIKFDINMLMVAFYKNSASGNLQKDFVLKFYICCFLYMAILCKKNEFVDTMNDTLILLTSPLKDEETIDARNRLISKIPEDFLIKWKK